MIISKIKNVKGQEYTVSGSVFGKGYLRLVEIMGFEIDVMPEGNMLLIENVDVPGVIGKVGRILGDSQINIAEFLLSRTSKGNNAFSIVKVDDRISSSLMQSLEKLDEIMKVIQLEV